MFGNACESAGAVVEWEGHGDSRQDTCGGHGSVLGVRAVRSGSWRAGKRNDSRVIAVAERVGMKVTSWAVILFSVLTLGAPADDIAGNWKAKVVSDVRHKTISQATFDFKVDGNHLSGTAHIGNDESSCYPGTAPISNGKISGHRVSFTVIGEHLSSSGLPTMKFDGTVYGEALDLTMILSFGSAPGDRMELKGERISK